MTKGGLFANKDCTNFIHNIGCAPALQRF